MHSNDFSMNLSGSYSTELNIASETIRVAISGSDTIKLKGNTKELACSIEGSGSI